MAESPEYDVIVVGGGFAGMAATMELQKDPTKKVLLLEAREELGGRTDSYSASSTRQYR
jgi:monoamine oxidase